MENSIKYIEQVDDGKKFNDRIYSSLYPTEYGNISSRIEIVFLRYINDY